MAHPALDQNGMETFDGVVARIILVGLLMIQLPTGMQILWMIELLWASSIMMGVDPVRKTLVWLTRDKRPA